MSDFQTPTVHLGHRFYCKRDWGLRSPDEFELCFAAASSQCGRCHGNAVSICITSNLPSLHWSPRNLNYIRFRGCAVANHCWYCLPCAHRPVLCCITCADLLLITYQVVAFVGHGIVDTCTRRVDVKELMHLKTATEKSCTEEAGRGGRRSPAFRVHRCMRSAP